jgi:hypothetical protein
MSAFYTYICTKSTADPYLPTRAQNIDVLSRDVSDAFLALSGGRFEVGKLAFYPVQRSVPSHLLCDGREVLKSSFPELYSYLGDNEGTATDPNSFKLPDYLSGFAPATTAETETATGSTVTTPAPAIPPPSYYPEQSDRPYGGVDSGGRYRENVQIP